ncbi:MAG: type II toxin-antitoxin system VapB family antitoxin [Myxococcota bacterium]
MTRTTLELDKDLIEAARNASGCKTIRDTIHAGLREIVAKSKRRKMLELEGAIQWQGDLDAWREDR